MALPTHEHHEEIAARIRSATAGYVLACEPDEHDRLRVVLAVPGARRHEVARRALGDVCEVLRALDVEAVDLTLLDPDDATVEQKHHLAAVTV